MDGKPYETLCEGGRQDERDERASHMLLGRETWACQCDHGHRDNTCRNELENGRLLGSKRETASNGNDEEQ